MTISKITNPPSQKGVIDKINEVIDSIGGSGGVVTSVNGQTGDVTISIPSAVTESTVSGWGFTKNTGTVTSVNNVSPVNGNVTLSIPSIQEFTTSEVDTIWNSITPS